MRQYPSQAPPQVRSVLSKLLYCRTPELGDHLYRCDQCDHQCRVYNSCGDRHCPQCSGAKRADWLDSTASLLLPEIPYFQVVFTMPDQLSSLTLGNRRAMFDLLFRAAWNSLKNTVETEQQFEAAAAMVLHTWNQHLDGHIHLHAMVPGGGPSLKKPGVWKASQPPAYENQSRAWLVNADALRVAFRTEFLNGLKRLHRKGLLKLTGQWAHLNDASAFDDWLKPFEEISWVTYIQKPPKDSSPEHVLKYLARYMTGGPISDRRLVRHENGQVTFSARTGKTHGGSDETEEVPLSGVEFVRRWCLHILPQGYTKSRRFGGYSPRHVKRYMTKCRQLLALSDPCRDNKPPTRLPVDPTDPHALSNRRCPNCETPMRLEARSIRPSWFVLLGPFRQRPSRYDDG